MLGLQRLQRHWRQWRQWQNARQAEGAHPGQPKRRQLSSCAADLTAACNSTGTNAEPVLDGVAGGAAQHSQPADGAGAEAEPAAASELKAAPPATPPPARPPLTQQHTLYGRRLGAPQRQVPEVFLRRGLSGRFRTLEGSKPRLVRLGALAALSGSYAVGSSSQIVASGLVDASIGEWRSCMSACCAPPRGAALLALSWAYPVPPCPARPLARLAVQLVMLFTVFG